MTTSDISFPAADGHPMRAAFAMPADAGKHPGVIVIHEIFGLNDDIRRITGKVADLGYAALAPDLYDGPGSRFICIARTLMTLNRGEGAAYKDLDAARKYLQQQPGVDSTRIGVIGFCMGGGFALMFAAQGRRLEKLLGELKVDHDVKIYPDAGHSFMSRNSGILASIGKISPMKAQYNPEAAEDSWKRIEAFFARHLGR